MIGQQASKKELIEYLMRLQCLLKKDWINSLLFVLLGLYLVFRFFNMSTFYPVIPAKTEKMLFLLLLIITGLKLFYFLISKKLQRILALACCRILTGSNCVDAGLYE